jgi:Ca2+-transporting ATPase
MITVGLAGLAITIGLLSMIEVGQHLFGSIQIGQSIAFTAFALCLIVAAVECRSETGTALTTATFDSKQMNWAILGELSWPCSSPRWTCSTACWAPPRSTCASSAGP